MCVAEGVTEIQQRVEWAPLLPLSPSPTCSVTAQRPALPRHSSWFMYVGMWGLRVLPAALPAPFSATLSLALLIYLYTNVEPQGLLVVRLPAPFVPHSTSLGPTTATRVLSAVVPVSAPPTGLDVCFFFTYLASDFLAIRFSVSSGCARRHSVSTYTTILVLYSFTILSEASSFPFIWGLFLCLPIVCETLLVSLCFLN